MNFILNSALLLETMCTDSMVKKLELHEGLLRNQRKRKGGEAVTPRKKVRLSTTDEPAVADFVVVNKLAVNSEAPATPMVATLPALKEITLPSKHWTLHELKDAEDTEGVCFALCSLNASTGEVNVDKAVFFTVDSAGVFHLETFVLGKLVGDAEVPGMQDTASILQQPREMYLCKGAAAQNEGSLMNNLTPSLQSLVESTSGAFQL